ncbi:MAG: class I SAM-dependent methyltransferase [Actinomycetota bacterium]
MTEPDYVALVRHYEACFARHGATAAGVDWPDEAGAALRYDVMLDLIRHDPLAPTTPTLLDFGCGAGGLLEHLRADALGEHIAYRGHDLSARYIEYCRQTYPDVEFTIGDVLDGYELAPVDYVVANGVFTERLSLGHDAMFAFMVSVLSKLAEVAQRGVAFNVMSTHVDWERDDLFHVDPGRVADLAGSIGRRFAIRHDYPLYEFTTYLYR